MVCSYYDVLSKTARTEKHQQKMEVRKTKGESSLSQTGLTITHNLVFSPLSEKHTAITYTAGHASG